MQLVEKLLEKVRAAAAQSVRSHALQQLPRKVWAGCEHCSSSAALHNTAKGLELCFGSSSAAKKHPWQSFKNGPSCGGKVVGYGIAWGRAAWAFIAVYMHTFPSAQICFLSPFLMASLPASPAFMGSASCTTSVLTRVSKHTLSRDATTSDGSCVSQVKALGGCR